MKKTIAVLVVVLALFALRSRAPAPAPVRFATFNIENYPKHDRQVDAAFREIAPLGASFIAVQEIVDPDLFARTAQLELGLTWDFVAASTAPRGEERRLMVQHLGVLFDRAVWTLASTAIHDGTRLEQGRHKPVLEVRLAPRGGGAIVRVLVVHLKAGGEGRAIRARQYPALAEILRAARVSGERVIMLGDFNATDDLGDRDDLAALADATDTRWLTEPLACSALWDRDDGCYRSRLDHILASEPAREVGATGACATHGCAMEASCPLYADEVSDHCPVVAEL